MKSRRKIVTTLLFSGIICLLVGVTYSFFNYTRTGGVNNLGTGTISFNTTQSPSLTLTNLFPMTSTEAGNANLDTVTVTITGATAYSEGEEYLISLVDVNNTVNNKHIPINFNATYEATTGNSIGTSNNNYFDANKNSNMYKLNTTGWVIEGKQVLVGYIVGSTGISGTLTISAYIDADRIAISDTYYENAPSPSPSASPVASPNDLYGTTTEWVDGRVVLTTTEWNSLSSTPISFKIRAESNEGIWVEEPEPDDVSPASCFQKRFIKLYTLNSNLSPTALEDCIDYFVNTANYFNNEEDAENYCLGTGKYYEYTLQALLDNSGQSPNMDLLTYLESHNIVTVEDGISLSHYNDSCSGGLVIPNKVSYTRLIYNDNLSSSEISICVNYLIQKYGVEVEDQNVSIGETYEDYCAGTGTIWGRTIQQNIDYYYLLDDDLSFFQANNIIINDQTKKYPVFVLDQITYDQRENPSPTKIVLNKDLRVINDKTFWNVDFNSISTLTIPNSVRFIGSVAFLPHNYNGNLEINILGKPYIEAYSINSNITVRYGGTCQELYDNSYCVNNLPDIIYGIYGSEHDVITTDTNYCKAVADSD